MRDQACMPVFCCMAALVERKRRPMCMMASANHVRGWRRNWWSVSWLCIQAYQHCIDFQTLLCAHSDVKLTLISHPAMIIDISASACVVFPRNWSISFFGGRESNCDTLISSAWKGWHEPEPEVAYSSLWIGFQPFIMITVCSVWDMYHLQWVRSWPAHSL